MWLFKSKLFNSSRKYRIYFLSLTSYISSTFYVHVAGGYHISQHRYRICLSSHKILWDIFVLRWKYFIYSLSKYLLNTSQVLDTVEVKNTCFCKVYILMWGERQYISKIQKYVIRYFGEK